MDHADISAARLREFIEHRSEKAFATLVRDHLNLVYSVALRRCGGQTGMAQDICQTVFTDFARKAATLPADVVVAGWLYQHASYVAATMLRAEDRRRRREGIAMQLRSLADDTDWPRLAPLLDDALLELEPSDRDPLVLRYLEKRPLTEVGSSLGLSENTARMRVDRALDKLRAKLAKRGVTSTASALAVAMAGPAVTAAPSTLAATISTAAFAAAATSSAFGLLSLMTSTQFKLVAVAAVLVAAGTGLVIQRIDTARLRRSSVDMERRLVLSGAELEAARSAAQRSSNDLAKLRPLQEELMRLRRQISADGRGTVQPVRPKSVPAAQEIDENVRTPIGILSDHGNATPEDASVSLLWAFSTRQRERYIELIKLPDDFPPDAKAWGLDYLYKNLGSTYGKWEFSSIRRGRTDDRGTRVYAGFKDPATGREDELVVFLREGLSGWQIEVDDLPREVPEPEQPAP